MAGKNLLRLCFALIIFLGVHSNVYAMEENLMNDTAITAAVKAKMLADEVVSASAIQVETRDGVVILRGDVKSKSEAEMAIDIASATQGVKDVDASALLVKGSNQPLTDTIITSKIKAQYAKEKIFGDKPITVMGIHVETNDGVVVLKGEVDTKAQLENAKSLAENVSGVRAVQSNLSVKNH